MEEGRWKKEKCREGENPGGKGFTIWRTIPFVG
jgi:hypothetical protein